MTTRNPANQGIADELRRLGERIEAHPEMFQRKSVAVDAMVAAFVNGSTPLDLCRKCGHRKDSHAVTAEGYHCSRCKCRRRFWR